MVSLKRLLGCMALVLMLASCSMTPKSSGNPYEVMIVAEDSLWNGDLGKTIKETLGKSMPMLPQEEPTLHISRVAPNHYDRITNLFRNIVVIDINNHFTRAKMEYQRDVFSSAAHCHSPRTIERCGF